MHRDWRAWGDGEVADINRALARGEASPVSADIIQLLRHAQDLENASGGLFNAGAGGLVGMWGFHTSEYPVTGPPPTEEAIQAWLRSAPSLSEVTLEASRLTSPNPAVQLDFGGIAKGLAVDRALAWLQARGFDQVMVNAGGDLRARGRRGTPWRVGISDPTSKAPGIVLASLEIHDDEAVFTSGGSQRFRQHGTERWPHVLDPRTGRPVSGLLAATVVADHGTLADAAATALLVAGPHAWRGTARDMGIRQAMVVDVSGIVWVSQALNRRLEWSVESRERVRVVAD